jgi:hypothetical protein
MTVIESCQSVTNGERITRVHPDDEYEHIIVNMSELIMKAYKLSKVVESRKAKNIIYSAGRVLCSISCVPECSVDEMRMSISGIASNIGKMQAPKTTVDDDIFSWCETLSNA